MVHPEAAGANDSSEPRSNLVLQIGILIDAHEDRPVVHIEMTETLRRGVRRRLRAERAAHAPLQTIGRFGDGTLVADQFLADLHEMPGTFALG